ncbi:MAG: hypothetical protein BGO98_34480 [Myxococcales bacterium 68-20]|nr:MAG: hypothetical protein BGO98_34480 [Myxococcales bacterium 68-20]
MLRRSSIRVLPVIALSLVALGEVRCVGDEPNVVPVGAQGGDAGTGEADGSVPGDDAATGDDAAVDADAAVVVTQHAGAPLHFPKSATASNGPHVAIDGAGNTFLAFTFDRPTTILGVTLAASGGQSDIAVLKISPAGVVLWNRVFGGSASDSVDALAVDAGSNVYIAGTFASDTLSFGGGASVTYAMQPGRGAPYIARLKASDGEGIAASTISGTSGGSGAHLALADNGLVLAYRALGSITVDISPSGTETIPAVLDSSNAVVASLDPSTLRAKWVNRIGASSAQNSVRGVALATNGDVFAALRIAARPLKDSKGSADLTDDTRRDVIVRLSASTGARMGAAEMPETAAGQLRVGRLASRGGGAGVAFTATLTGSFTTIGGKTYTSAGGTDIVVGELSVTADITSLIRYGGANDDAPVAITRRDSRTYVVATYGPGPIDLEGVSLPAGPDGIGATVAFEASMTGKNTGWVRAIRGENLEPTAVEVNPLANAVLHAGIFQGTAILGDGVEAQSVDPNVYNGFLVPWKK